MSKAPGVPNNAFIPDAEAGDIRRQAVAAVGWIPALSAFRHRNYGIFSCVQIDSLIGTWIQTTVEGWLVSDISGSSAVLYDSFRHHPVPLKALTGSPAGIRLTSMSDSNPFEGFVSALWLLVSLVWLCPGTLQAERPVKGAARSIALGTGVELEMVYIPPGKFMMGSTPEEKAWAVSEEGGASFSSGGGTREGFEGEPRPMQVNEGFWMGRTEVTVQQFRKFADETGFVTDAEKPGGKSQCFNPKWRPENRTGEMPWLPMEDKSWRDPIHGVAEQDEFPVVCVSYNDMKNFCDWLTKKARAAGSLPEGFIYRLPTEAEWAYACRGGRSDSSYFWWGDDLYEGKGRLNISAIDFLPGKDHVWRGAKLPWSDGYAMMSPVDHYGEKGRNGFGLADMCGGVWEFVLDHFDPEGGHEEVFYEDRTLRSVSRPVCRGENYTDVPGNARCAVRLGIHSVTYSDSRDGFRVCLGVPRLSESVKK